MNAFPRSIRRSISSLAKLKNDELRSLAFKTGIISSGTKSVLVDRLQHELQVPHLLAQASRGNSRILSIDMGIRNLAFCVLDVQDSALSSLSRKTGVATKDTPFSADLLNQLAHVNPINITVRAWQRTAVSARQDDRPLPLPEEDESIAQQPTAKEAFDPATFASIAYTLVADTLLPYNPTHIVIERQRYRSGGSPQVLEWTVRVNMFESMLHAVLRTLQQQQQHTPHGGTQFPEVHSVSPQKVARFFFENEVHDTPKKKMAKTRIEKQAKINVAEGYIRAGVNFCADAAPLRAGFLAACERSRTGKRVPKGGDEEGVERLTKVDDLADCFVQGMAWVQWEVNRRQAVERGILAEVDG